MTEKRKPTADPDGPETITTFYNGACRVCGTEIGHYRRLCQRRPASMRWHDLSDDPDALAEFGVSAEEARRRLHVIDEAGRLHSGVDAFVAIWRNMPVYRHLAGFVAMPSVRPFADFAYERVAVPALAVLNARRERHPPPMDA